MAKINWPPEKTFNYNLNANLLENDQLVVIPLEGNKIEDINKINRLKKENHDREI